MGILISYLSRSNLQKYSHQSMNLQDERGLQSSDDMRRLQVPKEAWIDDAITHAARKSRLSDSTLRGTKVCPTSDDATDLTSDIDAYRLGFTDSLDVPRFKYILKYGIVRKIPDPFDESLASIKQKE